MNFEKKAKTTAAVVTLVVHAGLILLCLICAFVTPLPLPGEEGVEVQLGYSDAGQANDYFVVPSTPKPIEPIETVEEEIEEIEEILTDDSEEVPFIDPEEVEPEEVEVEEEKVEEIEEVVPQEQEAPEEETPETEIVQPVVNPNALYRGAATNNNESTNSGTSGEIGKGGSQYGNENSENINGIGGLNEGTSFSLEGRSAVAIPKPEYSSQEQGIIVVEIVVNKRGDVIEAKAGVKGTTIIDQELWNKAYNAAMRTKFSPNPKAADKQVGTITYNFRRLNEQQ